MDLDRLHERADRVGCIGRAPTLALIAHARALAVRVEALEQALDELDNAYVDRAEGSGVWTMDDKALMQRIRAVSWQQRATPTAGAAEEG